MAGQLKVGGNKIFEHTGVSGAGVVQMLDQNGNVVLSDAGSGVSAELGSLSVDGPVVINESGADVDFRIESDTNPNAFFLEGSSGNVGIGTSSPSHQLHVSGSANIGGITMKSFGAGDTGISVNQGGGGGVALLLATRNTDAGTSTDAAVYLIQFYYSGDNLPNLIYLGGDSNWVTISKSASNTLVIDDKSGNDSYAIFGLSI